MKKNIVIISIIISIAIQLNAMEIENPPCFFKNMPADIMDLIASFLTFEDVETEEEFINRKKSCSSYPSSFYTKTKKVYTEVEEIMDTGFILITEIEREVENSEEEGQFPEEPDEKTFRKNRIMPLSWLQKHKVIKDDNNMFLVVYSPNKNICAMTHDTPTSLANELSIVNTKTNQALHTICLNKTHENNFREKYFSNLAISSSGNIFAIIYIKKINEEIGFRSLIKIKNLNTNKKDRPSYPTSTGVCPTIAFNKQDTLLIMQTIKQDYTTNKWVNLHTIIPLATTLDNYEPPQKTLSHYCAQKIICKNLML